MGRRVEFGVHGGSVMTGDVADDFVPWQHIPSFPTARDPSYRGPSYSHVGDPASLRPGVVGVVKRCFYLQMR